MNKPTIRRIALGGVPVCMLLMTMSCNGKDGLNGREASDVPPPVRHAVHSKQLQEAMSELGETVATSWPQEIQQDMRDYRETDYEEAQQLARLLAKTTRILPEAIEGTDMSREDRKAFMANVDLLASQASQLQASAREHRLQEMRRILDQIQTTCYGCHSQFRGEPGPLKFGG